MDVHDFHIAKEPEIFRPTKWHGGYIYNLVLHEKPNQTHTREGSAFGDLGDYGRR